MIHCPVGGVKNQLMSIVPSTAATTAGHHPPIIATNTTRVRWHRKFKVRASAP
jgi:hypothetical protein